MEAVEAAAMVEPAGTVGTAAVATVEPRGMYRRCSPMMPIPGTYLKTQTGYQRRRRRRSLGCEGPNGHNLTYTLEGADRDSFAIDDQTGQIKTKAGVTTYFGNGGSRWKPVP